MWELLTTKALDLCFSSSYLPGEPTLQEKARNFINALNLGSSANGGNDRGQTPNGRTSKKYNRFRVYYKASLSAVPDDDDDDDTVSQFQYSVYIEVDPRSTQYRCSTVDYIYHKKW